LHKTNIDIDEPGGITQHNNAFYFTLNSNKATVLDTPGHEAFIAMRARGGHATDIAILVVVADGRIKPQTIEALQHIKNVEISYMFVITKIDLPQVNIQQTKEFLLSQGVTL
jgi:translation initiation factor IF-2